MYHFRVLFGASNLLVLTIRGCAWTLVCYLMFLTVISGSMSFGWIPPILSQIVSVGDSISPMIDKMRAKIPNVDDLYTQHYPNVSHVPILDAHRHGVFSGFFFSFPFAPKHRWRGHRNLRSGTVSSGHVGGAAMLGSKPVESKFLQSQLWILNSELFAIDELKPKLDRERERERKRCIFTYTFAHTHKHTQVLYIYICIHIHLYII